MEIRRTNLKRLALLFVGCLLFSTVEAKLEDHFKPAVNKTGTGDHKMGGIDFIYMINLDQRTEKYERTMNVLRPYGIVPYRFSAVNGWKLSFEAIDEIGVHYKPGTPHGPIASVYRHVDGKEYHSYEIMKEEGVAYYCHSLSRGAIGCILSHLSVLQDAYDAGYNTIWVMEDDIKIVSNPHELSFFINILNNVYPDWDILFTDNEIKGADGTRVPCGWTRPRPHFQVLPLPYYLQRIPVHAEITKIGMRFGSHSMIIRRSGMKKLLDFFKSYQIYFPYDIDYFHPPGINLFACNRDIVTNISGGESDNGKPGYLEKENK